MDQHGSRSVRRRRGRLGAIAVTVAALAAACSWIPFDFDGDKKADVAWVDPEGAWWRSGQATPLLQPPVIASPYANVDRPTFQSYSTVPGDYDGNGIWEPGAVAVNGSSWITTGSRGTITFAAPAVPTTSQGCGVETCALPVPADYDGDGKTDPAWYRDSDASWWIEGQASPTTFGRPADSSKLGTLDGQAYDLPVPADYDGDKKADLALYDPTSATWTIRDSSTGAVRTVVAGHSGDVPVPADYDGDGRVEPATWGPLDDTWRIPGRADLVLTDLPQPGTGPGFWPAPANHDGNPGDEPAELDTTGGHWWISGQPRVDLGATSTWRLPAAARAAVVRSSMRITFVAHACGPGASPKPAYCT